MASKFYGSIGTQGGAAGDLDAINGGSLNNDDGAFVVDLDTNLAGIYVLDEDSAATEKADVVISPDASGGNKRWLLRALVSTGLKVYEPLTVSVTDIAMSSGNLLIDNQFDTGTITFQGEATGNKTMLAMDPAGSVDAYYANAKTFETVSGGIKVGDGTATGLSITYNADDAYIKNTDPDGILVLQARNAADDTTKNLFIGDPDGAVTLYYDGTQEAETISGGFKATNSFTIAATTNVTGILDDDTMAADSAVSLVTQQSIKAYVDASTAGGALSRITDTAGGVEIQDGVADGFTIEYSADDIYMINTDPAGYIFIQSRNSADAATHSLFAGTPDGASLLYYGGTARLTTTTAGVNIADGTFNGLTIEYSSDDILITNTDPDGEIFIKARNTGDSATNTLLHGDPDGAVSLYASGLLSMQTRADGLGVYDTSGDDVYVRFFDNAVALQGLVGFTNTTFVVSIGAGLENAIVATPNGAVDLYYNNIKEGETGSGQFKATNSLTIASTTNVTGILDEDNFASDSAVSLATQQSIKAYVDAAPIALNNIADMTGGVIIDDSVATGFSIVYDNDDVIMTNTDPDGLVIIKARDVTNSNNNPLFRGDPDEAVTLYHTGNDVFRTNGSGIDVLHGTSNSPIVFFYNGDATTLIGQVGFETNVLYIRIGVAGEKVITAALNGTTNIHYNDIATMSTTAAGISVQDGTADGFTIEYSADDLLLTNTDPDGLVQILGRNTADSATNVMINADPDASVDLYYDGTLAVSSALQNGMYGLTFASTAKLLSGTATPEGAITAPIGSMFLRTDGGADTVLYMKESGAGNTGWSAMAGV